MSLHDPSLQKTARYSLLKTLASINIGGWRERLVLKQETPRDVLAKEIEDIFEACVEAAFQACDKDPKDPAAWREVATTLAVAIFAGHLRPRGGQPVPLAERERLKSDVAELIKSGECRSVVDCCLKLIKRPPYNTMKGHRIGENIGLLTAAGLRKRYYD